MTSTVKAAIDELRLAYETAVASGRVEAIYPLLSEGAVMVHPGAPDWKAMAVAAGGAPFPAGAKIAISPIEVVALSDEWAYVSALIKADPSTLNETDPLSARH